MSPQINSKPIKRRKDFKGNWLSKHPNLAPKSAVIQDELFDYWSGQPIRNNNLSYSNYRPTDETDPNSVYVAWNDPEFIDQLKQYYKENYKGETLKPSGQTKSKETGKWFSKFNNLGNFTVSGGSDENGDFIQYYDVYDFRKGKPKLNKTEKLGAGKPFEVYDRIYLNENNNIKEFAMGGINRYNVPAQDRYFNTYVDLPYEQLMGASMAKQSQLERAQDMLTQTYADTQNLQYIPGSKDEAYVRDYINNVNNLVNKYYLQDMTDPIVSQQLRSEFNKMTNRQDLQNIQMSKQAWDVAQKTKAQQIAEGLYDPYLDEDPATGWNTLGSGVYSYINPTYKNPMPAAKEYFRDIEPSYLGPDETTGMWYEGVTPAKIKEVIEGNWNVFADTPEGRQYIKKMAKMHGEDYTDPAVRERISREYLNEIGEGFTWKRPGGNIPGWSAKGRTSGEGPIDREWYTRLGARNQAGDARTDKQALANEKKQYDQNVNDLDLINAQIDLLSKENIGEQDIRYKSLMDSKLKLENDISKYEDIENKINTEVQNVINENSEVLKNKFVPKIISALNGKVKDEEAIKSMIDAHRNIKFGSGMREQGFGYAASKVRGVARSIAALPLVGQLIVNKVHRNLNKIGILSEKDKSELRSAISKAVDEVQLSDNPTFGEKLSASIKAVKNYAASNKVTWGKDVYNTVVDKSFINQMADLDDELNKVEKNVTAASDEARARIYNYDVSDVLVKPLNYANKGGEAVIVSQDGTEYYSQFEDLSKAVKINPSSYKITDVSDGNRLKEDKNFNTNLQRVMATYDPLPGSAIPRIDKDGNLRVQFAYQISSPTASGDPIKKFEVKIDDDATIDALAQDYYASGYYDGYTRLAFRNIHRDVETNANSASGHDYILAKPNENGEIEKVSVRCKRVGANYIVESYDNPDKPAIDQYTGMELVFSTKEELENWLYSKQSDFLFSGR